MPYHVLVGNGEQVALLVAELQALLRHGLHGSRHVIVALGLLGQLGFLHQVVLIHFLGCGEKNKGHKNSASQCLDLSVEAPHLSSGTGRETDGQGKN